MIQMKFQEVQNKFLGRWTYQAQFHDPKAVGQALEWLAGRSCKNVDSDKMSIYLDDLQAIFEVRIQFDRALKAIRKAVPR